MPGTHQNSHSRGPAAGAACQTSNSIPSIRTRRSLAATRALLAAVTLVASCSGSTSHGRGLSAKSVLEHLELQHTRKDMGRLDATGGLMGEFAEQSQVDMRSKAASASLLSPKSSADLRRTGIMSGGDEVCMSLEFNPIEEEAVIAEDKCATNFDGKIGENFCNNPYFGGLLGCCFDNNNCFTCAEYGNCTEISLQCSSRYVRECSLSSPDEVLSDTFKSRQSTCAFVGDTGYWHQPGYLFSGDFSVVRTTNTELIDGCALQCSQQAGCNALTWRPTDRRCQMLQGFADGLTQCQNFICSQSLQVYILDTDDMYCAPESLECACTREYHNCMSINSCGSSEDELRSVADMCHSRGCSVQQCGLEPIRYGCKVAECANGFLECKMEGRGACDCIKEYVDCSSGFESFEFSQLSAEGWTFSELCAAEDCTAEQCGIPDTVCNSSSLECGESFVDCLGHGIDCQCIQTYMACMEESNCLFDELRTGLLDTCAVSGCEPEQCGFLQNEVFTLGCSEFSRMNCSREYLHCAEYGSECSCMRGRFECHLRWGCEVTAEILDESITQCAENNCTATECGLCNQACNVTQLFCVSAYHTCVGRASDADERCDCASAFYGCIEEGHCMTAENKVAHLEFCVADNCTAAACGVTDAQICNQTDLACTKSFIQCQTERLNPNEDRCALNYLAAAGTGEQFCTRTAFGGLSGCNYDAIDGSCYTSGDCACSRDYYLCMRQGCVAESPALTEFIRLCAERGCTAEQCGVEETEAAKTCNVTSLMCANDYLECANGAQIGDPLSEEEIEFDQIASDAPFCSKSFCLRYYYTCMKNGQCTSEEDELEHLKFCTAAGCTNEECGLLFEEEEDLLPDEAGADLVSKPMLILEASWQPSSQAVAWAAQGSVNQVLLFDVKVESYCESLQLTTSCETVLLEDSFAFYEARLASFQGIIPGTNIKMTVRQRNVNGPGPDTVITHKHVGVPSPPVDLETQRVGSLRVSATWGLPLDTGDGSQNVVLDAYILEIQTTPRVDNPVLIEVSPSELFAVLIHSVGGSYVECSAEGEECVCSGLVRFGDGTTWGEPARIRAPGRTMCEVGDVFPETRLVPSLGGPRRCQCSYDSVELEKGEELTARVAADNFVGRSNFSEPSMVRVMGRPGPVAEFEVDELQQSMLVKWKEPPDTGFGENAREPAEILEYSVYISQCPNFMPRGCTPNLFIVTGTQCVDGYCELEIRYDEEGSLFPLVAGDTYYLTVVATNEVATGYLFYAPVFRRTWKIKPIIVSPAPENFPLRVAEYKGASKIWLRGGSGSDSVVLVVDNFGRLQVGTFIFVEFVKGLETRRVGLRLYDRQLTTDEADFNDPLGVEVRDFFLFTPPVFGTGAGPASGVMRNGIFTVQVDLEYFEYPKPEVSLLPTIGPLGGGNFAQVSFREVVETQTRYAAGLPNFKSSAPPLIRIVFGSRIAQILQTTDPALDTRNFLIEVPSSSLGRNNDVTLSYFIGNDEMDVVPLTTYRYLGLGIESVVPTSGLTTGGTDIIILIAGVKGVRLRGNPIVNLGGSQAVVHGYAFAGVDSASLQIDATTSAVDSPGLAAMEVILNRIDLSPVVLNATDLFTFILPPDPFIQSVRVAGRRRGQRWTPTFTSVEVTIVVRYLFVAASDRATVRVQFGDYAASIPTSIVPQGDNSDVRLVWTTIVVQSPIVADPGFVNITVTANIGGVAVSLVTPRDLVFEFRDVTNALVWDVEPAESSTYGGALMLAGLTGFCKDVPQCPPGAFTAAFLFENSTSPVTVAATIYGSVTLQSWLDRDSAFDGLIQGAEVGAILEVSSVQTISRLSDVAAQIAQFIEDYPELGINTTNTFMLLMISPPSPTRETSETVPMTVSAGVKSAAFPVSYVADPTGTAIVEGVAPTRGTLQSGIPVQVQLSNFGLVYRPSDVVVKVMLGPDGGDIFADVLQVMESSSLRTRIEFELPGIPAAPDEYTFAVYLSRNINNNGTFIFEFLGINLPYVENFFPSLLYAEGGVTITVIAGYYGTQNIVKEEVFVQLTQIAGLEILNVVVDPTAVSYDPETGFVTILFTAPAFNVGLVSALVVHRGTGDSVEIGLTYLTIPEGIAVLELDPTVGQSTGGELIQCSLTNFRIVDAIEDFVVTFGSTELPVESLQRFQSTLEQTYIWVFTPFSPFGGEVLVSIKSKNNPTNVGNAQFEFVDVNKAQLDYVFPIQGDAGREHLIDLTISNLGVTISDPIQLDTNWDGVEGLTTFDNPKPIVDSIVFSNVERVDLKLRVQIVSQLSAITERKPVTMYVGLLGDSITGLKTVAFVFTFIPRGETYVETFLPRSYYTDGGVPMTIEATNVPPQITDRNLISVSFGTAFLGDVVRQLPNATVTSLVRIAGGNNDVRLECMIPQVTLLLSQFVTPSLIFAAPWSYTVAFSEQFEYVVPPNVRIVSMFPTTGPTTATTILTLVVQFFPRVSMNADIRVEFNRVPAVVVSFIRTDETKDPNELQEVSIQVEAPCCTADVLPGETDVIVYHRSFPFRASLPAIYDYFDPDSPTVIAVIAKWGNLVRMSEPTPVQVILAMEWTSESPLITLNGDVLLVTEVTSKEGVDRVAIFFDVNEYVVPGDAVGEIFFVSLGVRVKFTVRYYDDTIPFVLSVAPTEGPETGGTAVMIQIAHNRNVVIVDPSELLVRFGGELADVLEVQSVSVEETNIRVLTPPYPVSRSDGVLLVAVTIFEIDSMKTTPPFEFVFLDTVRALASVQPTTGTIFGGDVVFVGIEFFPLRLLNRDIIVEFGDIVLDPVNITITSAETELTQLKLITPRALPGTVTVVIYPRQDNGADSVSFDFEYVDPRHPVLRQPIPRRSCANVADTTKTILVGNLNPLATTGNTLILVGSCGWVQPSDVSFSGLLGVISFDVPLTATPSEVTITVIQPTNSDNALPTSCPSVASVGTAILSFPYEFLDCTVPRVLSYEPTSGVHSGGVLVNVRLSLFPTDILVSFANVAVPAASIRIIYATEDELNFEFRTPFVYSVGNVKIEVTGFGPNGTITVLEMDFQTVPPCDFESFCFVQGLVQNVQFRLDNPPITSQCDVAYCIAESKIPYPSLVVVSPTEGPTSGTTVTLQVSHFPQVEIDEFGLAVDSTVAVEIIAMNSVSRGQLTSLTYSGSNVLTSTATLVFDMPPRPAGLVTVVVQSAFGQTASTQLVTRTVRFDFVYYRVVFGPAVVDSVSPSQFPLTASPLLLVTLSNFPLLSPPLNTGLISFQVGSQSPIVGAEAIVTSTRDSTVALISIPSGYISCAQTCNATLLVFYTSHGAARAGSGQLLLVADPDPRLDGVPIPEVILRTVETQVDIRIAHMPLNLAASDLATTIRQGAVVISIDIVQGPTYASDECVSVACSSLLIRVRIPVDSRLRDDVATIRTCAGAACVDAEVELYSSATTVVRLVDPSRGLTTQTTPVTIYLDNFPSSVLSTDIQVRTGGATATAVTVQGGRTFERTILTCILQPPLNAGLSNGLVWGGSLEIGNGAAFVFQYVHPDATIEPIDAPTSIATTIVTVKFYWGIESIRLSDLTITMGGVVVGRNSYLTGQDELAVSNSATPRTISFFAPSRDTAQSVEGSITTADGRTAASFSFLYFNQPRVVDVQPRQASLEGWVDVINGNTIRVDVERFPDVLSQSDFVVLFDPLGCNSVACLIEVEVESFWSSATLLSITLIVPEVETPLSDVGIIVRYTGGFSFLAGQDPDAVRSLREADSRDADIVFRYLTLVPYIEQAQYCASCESSPCVRGRNCHGSDTGPVQAELGPNDPGPVELRLPRNAGGVLTLKARHFVHMRDFSKPAATDYAMEAVVIETSEIATISVSIDGVRANVVNVLWSSAVGLKFECIPEGLSGSGRVTGTVTVAINRAGGYLDSRSATFTVRLFDPAVSIECTSGCAGSVEGNVPATLILNNFNVILTNENVNAELAVHFGIGEATNITVVSSTLMRTVIRVISPPCTVCEFEEGRSTVDLEVELRESGSIFGFTDYTYVEAPRIFDVRFSNSGTRFTIKFDQKTNKGGLSDRGPCTSLLMNTNLGVGARCEWKSESELKVKFGDNPTIVVGDLITFYPDVLKSEDELSPFFKDNDQLSFPIRGPSRPKKPGPMAIAGPQEVDGCSGAALRLMASSPRGWYSMVWECKVCGDNMDLDLQLKRYKTNVVDLPADLLRIQNGEAFQYEITLKVTDFMGVVSDEITHFVTKKKRPAPMASILVYQVYYLDDDILLRGNTLFSNCPPPVTKDTMSFKWSSSDIDDESLFRNSPQLSIPARTLGADTTYTVDFEVQFDYEATYRSRATVSFYVGHASILAVIDGGDEFQIAQTSELSLSGANSRDLSLLASEDQGLTYEWTCKYESDPCRGLNQELLPVNLESIFTLGSGSLFASASYLFKLVVKKGPTRRATRSVNVRCSGDTIPTVGITHKVDEVDAVSGIVRVNGLKKLKLKAQSDVRRTDFFWSVDPPLLSDSTATVKKGYTGKDLVFHAKRGQELFIPGFVYTITLVGRDESGLEGTASLQVEVNVPPEGGSCQLCLDGADDCEAEGEALADTYVMSCSNWADEDQPLHYRFGMKHRKDKIDWMNVLDLPERHFRLQEGKVILAVEVIDASGAASAIYEKEINVKRYQKKDRGRRDLLQSSEPAITEHIEAHFATLEEDLKRAFIETVFAGILTASLELENQALEDTDRYSYTKRMLDLVIGGLTKVAETVGHFEEAAVAAGAVMQTPCRAEGESVIAALNVMSSVSALKDTFPAASEGYVQNVLEVLASTVASSSTSACGALNKITGADATDWMKRTRSITKVVLASLISDFVEGEEAAEFFSTYANHSAFTSTLSSESGELTLGSIASFSLPSTDGTAERAIIRGDEIIPDFVEEFIDIETDSVMLGTVLASLSIFEAAVPVTQPGTFTITIPMDEQQSRAKSGNAWTQRANCNFFDEATGKMSFDGCTPVDTQPSFVVCQCNHLTTFSAGLDPALTYCGDGVIAGLERCDDENERGGDGCSTDCIVEDGALCIGQGDGGSGPSRCCARCPGGFERLGCDPNPGKQLTNCTRCPDGKYRPDLGNWDDVCLECNRAEKQIPNEPQTACMFDPLSCGDKELDYWEQCDDGARVSGDGCAWPSCQIEEGASCVWNPAVNISVCCARCPAGTGREVDCALPDVVSPCVTCRPGTFREYGGSYSDQCDPCPAATYSTGGAQNCTHWPFCEPGKANYNGNSTFPGDCRPCDPAFWARVDPATNASECARHISCPPGQELVGYGNSTPGACEPCHDRSYKPNQGNYSTECTPCPVGLFSATDGATDVSQCNLFVCGDGARSDVNEGCDDGNVDGLDGCSSTCTVEDGFVCNEDASGLSTCRCQTNYYGDDCTIFCSRADNCNSRGECTSDAGCSCDRFWLGLDCTFEFPADESYSQAITSLNTLNRLDFGRVTLTFLANSISESITVTADIANDPTVFSSQFQPSAEEDLIFLDGIVDLRPESTTFSPSATMAYSLPSGLDSRTVPVIANYNFDSEKWERLPSTYNAATNSVSAQLSHFSLYAPMSPTPTGTFPPTPTTASPETTPDPTPETTAEPPPTVDTTPTPIIPREIGGGGGLSDGELAAVIVGPTLFVLALIAAFLYWRRRQQQVSGKIPDDTVPLIPPSEVEDGERRDSRELEVDMPDTVAETPGEPPEEPPEEPVPRDESEHPPSIPPGEEEDDEEVLLKRAAPQDDRDALRRNAPPPTNIIDRDPGEVVWDQSPAPGLWTMCRSCENPVKTIWPRCPKCKTAIEDSDSPLAPSDQARMQQKVDLVRVQGQFDLECSNCHAPVKSSWPRCPSCKTDTSSGIPVRVDTTLPDTPQQPTVTAELELAGSPLDRSLPIDLSRTDLDESGLDGIAKQAGFDAVCKKCESPVKSTWPRCPSCKTKIEASGAKSGQPTPARTPAVIEVTPLKSRSLAGAEGVSADFVSAGQEPRRPSVLQTSQIPIPTDESQLPAILQGMGEPCRMCGGPMKAKWDKCPTCKFPAHPVSASPATPAGAAPSTAASITPTAIEKHRRDLGFDQLCVTCNGPVKPTWPRCPTCKTPIEKKAKTAFNDPIGPSVSQGPMAMPGQPDATPVPESPAPVSQGPMAMPGQPDITPVPESPAPVERSTSGLPGSARSRPTVPDRGLEISPTPQPVTISISGEPEDDRDSVAPASPPLGGGWVAEPPSRGSVAPSAASAAPSMAPSAQPPLERQISQEDREISQEPADLTVSPAPATLNLAEGARRASEELRTEPLSQHISQTPPLPAYSSQTTEAWPAGQGPDASARAAPAPVAPARPEPEAPAPTSARVVWAGPPRNASARLALAETSPTPQPPPLATSEAPSLPPSDISGLQASARPQAPSVPPSMPPGGSAAPSDISGLQASARPQAPPASVPPQAPSVPPQASSAAPSVPPEGSAPPSVIFGLQAPSAAPSVAPTMFTAHEGSAPPSVISGLQAPSAPPSVAPTMFTAHEGSPPPSAPPSVISGLQASYPPSLAPASVAGSMPPLSQAGDGDDFSVAGRRSLDLPEVEEVEEHEHEEEPETK